MRCKVLLSLIVEQDTIGCYIKGLFWYSKYSLWWFISRGEIVGCLLSSEAGWLAWGGCLAWADYESVLFCLQYSEISKCRSLRRANGSCGLDGLSLSDEYLLLRMEGLLSEEGSRGGHIGNCMHLIQRSASETLISHWNHQHLKNNKSSFWVLIAFRHLDG